MNTLHFFSATYADARHKFLESAGIGGAVIEGLINPNARGAEGEELALDVARFGAMDAESLLIVCSGTHGNEGVCGSGCQIGLIAERVIGARPQTSAVLLLHAVNPSGFSAVSRRVCPGPRSLQSGSNSARVELVAVLEAIRGDNWLYAHGIPSGLGMESPLARAIKANIRGALTIDTHGWRDQVFTRAADFAQRALRALAGQSVAPSAKLTKPVTSASGSRPRRCLGSRA